MNKFSENPNGLQLSEDEKVVKKILLDCTLEAEELRIDEDIHNTELTLPSWYNDVMFKRGQQYFANNRTAILASNLIGLIGLLSSNKALKTLSATGRSNTAETARRRYVSTVLHTVDWYQEELVPGSASWESLSRVRRMHYNASKLSERKNIGFISQFEATKTLFGFMGFALIRPQIFHIKHDNADEIEAFIHLWAVIGHMLGIKDEYNICLQSTNIVKITCQALLRYIILPALQLESPQFKVMTKAMLDGLNEFVPQISYEYQMFLTRRAAGVPGHQHSVDLERETLCRSILTPDEIEQFLNLRNSQGEEYWELMLFSKIPVYEFTKISDEAWRLEDVIVENGETRPMDAEMRSKVRKYMDLEESTCITLKLIDYETEWKSSLNDSKFYELKWKDQNILRFSFMIRKLMETSIGNCVYDFLVSWTLKRFRNFVDGK